MDLSPCSGPKILNLGKFSVNPLTLLLSIMCTVVHDIQSPMRTMCFLLSKIILSRVILAIPINGNGNGNPSYPSKSRIHLLFNLDCSTLHPCWVSVIQSNTLTKKGGLQASLSPCGLEHMNGINFQLSRKIWLKCPTALYKKRGCLRWSIHPSSGWLGVGGISMNLFKPQVISKKQC